MRTSHSPPSTEALQQHVQALQMKVQSLEAQLQRIHQTPVAAQRSREAGVATLAAGIAHEFNNLLGPILMAAETLKRNAPDEKTRHRLTFIERNARRGADIVQHLIAFEKGAKVQPERLDLHSLLQQAPTLAQGHLPPNVSVQLRLPESLPALQGDAAYIRQALQHLFRNAGEAMPSGGAVTVDAQLCAPPTIPMPGLAPASAYVCIAVSDTGHGIPPKDIPYIFDPFFTTKVRGQCTGLGLTAVASIMKGHEGGVTVESAVNQGTRFTLYFPVPPEPLPSAPVVTVDDDDLFADDFAWDDP